MHQNESAKTTVRKIKSENLHLLEWETQESSPFYRQYLTFLALLGIILIVYIFRLWHLQVLQGAKYRYQSENNRIRLEDIPAPRGIIFDRNGVPLVENRPAYHLMLIREDVSELDETLERLARLCGKSMDEFKQVLENCKRVPKFVPIRLVEDLDRDSLARIEAQRVRLPGVSIQVEPKREYRWNGTASHLIGYLSEITEDELRRDERREYLAGEDIGKVGVEKAYEGFLHGVRGGRQVEVDAVGRRIRVLDQVLPIPGRNIWLTIDIELQRVAEECLKGEAGAIVALDPENGAVLAMASSPTFDQERFIKGFTQDEWDALIRDSQHPLLNRATDAAYPPGSTIKPFVLLAALQEGVIGPNTVINCPGFVKLGKRKFRCWRTWGHGKVNPTRALVESCDVFLYQTGMKLGVDRITEYANWFGLGRKTLVDLHRENVGLMPTRAWKAKTHGSSWQKGETLSVAIGQGYSLATPLQLAVAYAAVANGGIVWRPQVVRRIEGNDTSRMNEIESRVRWRIPVQSDYVKMVQKALLGVVEEKKGTAHRIKLENVEIAGKTGTAQVVRLPDKANRKQLRLSAKREEQDHAWFVGYAPARAPKIVVCAIVEHGGHGSAVAAPLVQKVIAAYLGVEVPAAP